MAEEKISNENYNGMQKIVFGIEAFALKILRILKLGFLADIYESHIEGMRYLVFGALATLVNLITAAICYELLFTGLNADPRTNLSTIISIIAAVVFAYITNKHFVFMTKSKDLKDLIREITSFMSCRLATAIIEIIFMNIVTVKLHLPFMIMKVVINIIVILLNFIFSKILIFKKNDQNIK